MHILSMASDTLLQEATFLPDTFGTNIGDEPSNWAVAFLATWNYHHRRGALINS